MARKKRTITPRAAVVMPAVYDCMGCGSDHDLEAVGVDYPDGGGGGFAMCKRCKAQLDALAPGDARDRFIWQLADEFFRRLGDEGLGKALRGEKP